jgi:hypothetical protein
LDRFRIATGSLRYPESQRLSCCTRDDARNVGSPEPLKSGFVTSTALDEISSRALVMTAFRRVVEPYPTLNKAIVVPEAVCDEKIWK